MSAARAVRRPLAGEERGSWTCLRAPAPRGLTPFAGGPGPWKAIVVRGRARLVFDVPTGRALGVGDDVAFADAVHRWAEVTRDGAPPPDWTAPTVDELVPAAREDAAGEEDDDVWRVRVACGVVRGELVRDDARLALRFPLAPVVPAALGPGRRAWLHRLLQDAQARWRQVRFRGLGEDGPLLAEVDLTGAPGAYLEPLARTALGGLRWVVRWIQPSVSTVLDPTLRSEVLDDFADEPRSHKETHHDQDRLHP